MKFYNKTKTEGTKSENPIEFKISNLLIHDLDIQPYTKLQVEQHQKYEWKDEILIQIIKDEKTTENHKV